MFYHSFSSLCKFIKDIFTFPAATSTIIKSKLLLVCLKWAKRLVTGRKGRQAFEEAVPYTWILLQMSKDDLLFEAVKDLFLKSIFHFELIPKYESVILQLEGLERPKKKKRVSEDGHSTNNLAFPKLLFEQLQNASEETPGKLSCEFPQTSDINTPSPQNAGF